MTSQVYFLPYKSLDRYDIFLKCVDWNKLVLKNEFVAIKMHFGEEGNKGFINPDFIKPIVKLIKNSGGKAFLTDTNTVYIGKRSDAVNHLEIANAHGFSQGKCTAPVIIADGLRGNSDIEVVINKKHFENVNIAKDIYYSDVIIAVSHFKGHELTGFGGALKNIGMGCASRKGKYKMHDSVVPDIRKDKCTGCGSCLKWCSEKALSISDKKAIIDVSLCIGCGECILSCPNKVIRIPWNESTKNVQEKIVEHFYGVVKNKQNKIVFINFITFVTPQCDCFKTISSPVVEDIGVLVSYDPVAIDQASVDLVNNVSGKDLFRTFWPEIDWRIQLEYAEKLNLGTRQYVLSEVST